MWHRPAAPGELARNSERLTHDLGSVWQNKHVRRPRLDPVLRHGDVVAALLEMTGSTCAYCERSLDLEDPDAVVVAHHRPAWGAMSLDGHVDLQAYWWLAYDWHNLFPACSDCVRTRGTRFPVAGERARWGQDTQAEQPLLLDPLADVPDDHLRYEPDGTVSALTERGRVTVETLALNREHLVHARLAMMEGSADAFAFPTLRRQLAEPEPEPVRAGSAGDSPQGARGRTELRARRSGAPATHPDPPAMPPPVTKRPAGPTLPPVTGAQAGMPDYDLSTGLDKPRRTHYFQATQWVERVVIKNFRPIRYLEVDLSRSTSEQGPWTVLLGENGSGKSSVLHAIVLTLMGGEQRRALGIDARNYLRHGARQGLVQVFLTGRTDPLELTWTLDDVEFHGPEPVPALLLAYGATRLLPRAPEVDPGERVVRVDNLFDPLRALADPTAWLLSLDDDAYDEVAAGIQEMLALDQDSYLIRERDRVVLRQGRTQSDLSTLSDGYQAMVVMACDILRSVLQFWEQPTLAEGIVLIDEIGAHLHPRWRMRIVGAVRRLLPRVQFIVTTHDPLCLRGVLDGEVTVVRRNSEGDVVTLSDLPPVTGMRIDQLLTSEHFGLGSTDDPEVAELWEAYYRLRALTRPTDDQAAELERVRGRLDRLEQFGTTERDRLLLTSAADYIAQRRETGDVVAPTDAEVTTQLAQLWGEYLPGGGA